MRDRLSLCALSPRKELEVRRLTENGICQSPDGFKQQSTISHRKWDMEKGVVWTGLTVLIIPYPSFVHYSF